MKITSRTVVIACLMSLTLFIVACGNTGSTDKAQVKHTVQPTATHSVVVTPTPSNPSDGPQKVGTYGTTID